MSERTSMSSRHRRKSVPSFSSGRHRREGSVDPLLEGSYSDDSGDGRRKRGSSVGSAVMHRSVSRGELDRTDAQSVARSYNETIIRAVTRPLHTPTGTSYRSSRSRATSEVG